MVGLDEKYTAINGFVIPSRNDWHILKNLGYFLHFKANNLQRYLRKGKQKYQFFLALSGGCLDDDKESN